MQSLCETLYIASTKDNFERQIAYDIRIMPLSKQLTEKQIKKLEEEFLELDEDGDGTITVEEIGKILRSMKKALKVNESEIKRVLADIDKDGDGAVNICKGQTLLQPLLKSCAEYFSLGLFGLGV